MSLCMIWEIIASLAGFFTYAQSRNGWNYSNEILHIESLAGCSDIFETASKLVQGFGMGGVHFSVFPLTLALASNTVILESPWKVLDLFVSTAVWTLHCQLSCSTRPWREMQFLAQNTSELIWQWSWLRPDPLGSSLPPPLDNIWAMMIVWRITWKIIRTVLCNSHFRATSITPVLIEKAVVDKHLYLAFLSPPPHLTFTDQFAFHSNHKHSTYIQGAPEMEPFLYFLTAPNINRFSQLNHCQNHEKICNNTISNFPTTPQVCRYTTLWNVYVSLIVPSISGIASLSASSSSKADTLKIWCKNCKMWQLL